MFSFTIAVGNDINFRQEERSEQCSVTRNVFAVGKGSVVWWQRSLSWCWTGQCVLLQRKDYPKFHLSLLKVQDVSPSGLPKHVTDVCVSGMALSELLNCLQNKTCPVSAPCPAEQVRARASFGCSWSLEGSWAHLAMTGLHMGGDVCGRGSTCCCWIPQFYIWTWNLCYSPGLLCSVFISVM